MPLDLGLDIIRRSYIEEVPVSILVPNLSVGLVIVGGLQPKISIKMHIFWQDVDP